MGFFRNAKPKAGGAMDEIHCDEPSYLIWKWHPYGSQAGNNRRENAIRWGSSLRVKDGEVAVFAYNQDNGVMEDFIEGPCDTILETKNLPVLANIIGLAYDGGTPFQAEVYFINLARAIQVPFGVPYFDMYDPRFPDFGVPTAVRGRITFNIANYREFIKLHRLSTFDLQAFQTQIREAIARYVKNIVMNVPEERNIPVVQIERQIGPINDAVEQDIRERFERDFGVNIVSVDISDIEIDKESDGYQQLKSVTQDIAAKSAKAKADIDIKTMQDSQRINAENIEETLRIQREESQYAQHKQTQSANLSAYQLEQQAAVGIAGAEALGNMGTRGGTEVDGNGMNPAAMIAGIAMGGAIGQNIAGMMNSAMQGINSPSLNQPMTTLPPVPDTQFYVVINGAASGPFNMNVLTQMASNGQLKETSYVWKQGMKDWAKATDVQEFRSLFESQTPPPVPGSIPPVPPE